MFVHSSIDGQNWGLKDCTAAGSRVPNNAAVVENLVTAGVISLLSLLVLQLTRIVLGKTNMSVMSNGYGAPGQPTGWSPLGGQTKSAYGEDLAVNGSSTGSAVALSAGFCAASLGCQTDGSIVSLIQSSVVPLSKIAF